MKVLVAGWFSFEYGSATAGDLLARDLVCEWLDGAGVTHDVALDPPFQGGVDWRRADPDDYTHVVWVCGPFTRGNYEGQFLARFSRCLLFGVDLTMQVPLGEWNPFDFLTERDSSAAANPDITFLSRRPLVPVIGVCLVEPYKGAETAAANDAVRRLVGAHEAAVVEIDTRLDANGTGLRTASEVESLLARMDVVVTTRLHGAVLSLKNGVPVVAIDPEPGGAKIRRQAEVTGWPTVFNVDTLSDEALSDALRYCLTDEARAKARACAVRASERVEAIRQEFLAALARPRPADTERGRDVADANFLGVGMAPVDASLGVSVADRSKRWAKAVARRTLPAPARRWLRGRFRRTKGLAEVFIRPARLVPVSHEWGYDQGLPVDRYYIENFLERHAADVRGRVVEIGDNSYTKRFGTKPFGGSRVTTSDVLDVARDNPKSTLVADLNQADDVPSDTFDCAIITQTLHLIYDVRAALATLHRILKPGGVLLTTFPGITPISVREWPGSWYWGFTSNSARRLFGEAFPEGDVQVESHGNVLTACSFLYGLAAEELSREELNYRDPTYETVITVRAVKSRRSG